MELTIKNKTYKVDTLAAASKLYGQLRDKSGKGSSSWPNGSVSEAGEVVALISYNGNVWPNKEWAVGDHPLLLAQY